MDKLVLQIFQDEIKTQCNFSIIAFKDIEQAILDIEQGLQNFYTERFWYSVQNFLVSVGNISKILWPPDQKMSRRGDELRASLKIKGDSLLKPRTFRNHFEHFDERIEEWVKSSRRQNFIDECIGPTGAISGVELGDYLRNFDTTLFAVTFRGDTYKLRPLADEIKALWNEVHIAIEKFQ